MAVRKNREQWVAVVAAFEQSGESLAKFCKKRRIRVASLKWWRWRLRDARAATALAMRRGLRVASVVFIGVPSDPSEYFWRFLAELGLPERRWAALAARLAQAEREAQGRCLALEARVRELGHEVEALARRVDGLRHEEAEIRERAAKLLGT
jgi:pimeloyl-ACP methyl ester carboxylesterase